jgi:hypothetical protein
VALTLGLGAPTAVVPTRAAASQPPEISLDLVRQPVFMGPDDRLGISVAIHNRSDSPIRGGRLILSVEDRVGSRSALHASFEGPAPVLPSSFPVDFEDRIPAGGRATIHIRDRVTSFLLLDQATEGGVYPLTISLVDPAGQLLDSLGTPLIFYPSRPDPPLKMVVVVPVNALPGRGPGSAFRADAGTGQWPLEESVVDSGWLRGLARALRGATRRGVDLGIAPTPRLVEELDDMRDGYERARGSERATVPPEAAPARGAAAVLDLLRTALRSPRSQPVLSPYSLPDLTELSEQSFDPDALEKQFRTGDAVLDETLDVDFDPRWVLPPRGRLDEPTLDNLALSGIASRTFAAGGSLVDPVDPSAAGCPQTITSFTCPIRIESESAGASLGYATDEGLQDRWVEVARGTNARVALQRFFAETAMIREESPGIEDRVVQTTLPDLWEPRPQIARLLFEGLADAPWLKTVTPDAGLAAAEARDRRLVGDASRSKLLPLEGYHDALAEAAADVAHYASIEPPDGRVESLRRDLLVAQSRMWWAEPTLVERGRSYSAGVSAAIATELGKVTVQVADEVTLSSRRAPIPISVSNETDYPVTVRIVLRSDKIRNGSEEVRRTFGPAPNQALKIFATPEASGTFPLEVQLVTPDGYRFYTDTDTEIRSTDFNRIALGITLGALLFLILFYTARLVRRRREDKGAPAGVAQA